jgi:hypothetical protein
VKCTATVLLADLSYIFVGEGRSAINAIDDALNTIENLFANKDNLVKISAAVTRALVADVPPHCQGRSLPRPECEIKLSDIAGIHDRTNVGLWMYRRSSRATPG